MQSGISLQRQRGTLRTEDYRAVFQASPDGILVVDDRGKIRDANPAAARLFRCTLEELVGQSVDALVPEPARAGHAAYRGAYAVERRPRAMGIGMELRARRRDGTEFPVEISLSPWETPDGALTIATVRDVTQRKRERDDRQFYSSDIRAQPDPSPDNGLYQGDDVRTYREGEYVPLDPDRRYERNRDTFQIPLPGRRSFRFRWK